MKLLEKKHLFLWVGWGLALVLSTLLAIPASRFALFGLIKNEPFYRGKPAAYWREALKDPGAPPFRKAVGILRQDEPAAVPLLIELLKDENGIVRTEAAEGLVRIKPGADVALRPLMEALHDREAPVAKLAAQALG